MPADSMAHHTSRQCVRTRASLCCRGGSRPVGEQQVGELEVAVDDPAAVQEGHAAQQLLQQTLHLQRHMLKIRNNFGQDMNPTDRSVVDNWGSR